MFFSVFFSNEEGFVTNMGRNASVFYLVAS